LGFGFVPTYDKGSKNQYQFIVSEKAWKKLKERLKTITRKTTPATFEERIAKIKEVQRGWLNYFQGTSILGKLRDLDGWLRNRLRYLNRITCTTQPISLRTAEYVTRTLGGVLMIFNLFFLVFVNVNI
jgi:hypothetical protein